MADYQELRILRNRQAALGRAIDRAVEASPLITARMLVQVYNGGAMPTSPDKVYLTHPVELDGTEIRGWLRDPERGHLDDDPRRGALGRTPGRGPPNSLCGRRPVGRRAGGTIGPDRLPLRPVSNPAEEPHRLVDQPDSWKWVDHASLLGQSQQRNGSPHARISSCMSWFVLRTKSSSEFTTSCRAPARAARVSFAQRYGRTLRA